MRGRKAVRQKRAARSRGFGSRTAREVGRSRMAVVRAYQGTLNCGCGPLCRLKGVQLPDVEGEAHKCPLGLDILQAPETESPKSHHYLECTLRQRAPIGRTARLHGQIRCEGIRGASVHVAGRCARGQTWPEVHGGAPIKGVRSGGMPAPVERNRLTDSCRASGPRYKVMNPLPRQRAPLPAEYPVRNQIPGHKRFPAHAGQRGLTKHSPARARYASFLPCRRASIARCPHHARLHVPSATRPVQTHRPRLRTWSRAGNSRAAVRLYGRSAEVSIRAGSIVRGDCGLPEAHGSADVV